MSTFGSQHHLPSPAVRESVRQRRRPTTAAPRRRKFPPRDLIVRPLAIDELPLLNGLDRSGSFWSEPVWMPASGPSLPAGPVAGERPLPLPDWKHPEMLHRYDLWRREWTPQALLLGALHRGRLVGLALVGPLRRRGETRLHCLYVEPPSRRRGVASRLLAGTLAAATHRQVTGLDVQSTFGDGTMSFYLRHGFQVVAPSQTGAVEPLHRWDRVRLRRAIARRATADAER